MPLTLKHLTAYLILLTIPCTTFSASSEKRSGPIVVTIKPLYSLVSQLNEGIEKPVLLLKKMPSPHHYTMRPSEHRLLSNARMIVWIGPQMESYLSKVIQQQDAIVVSAMQANGLRLLGRRIKNSPQPAAGSLKSDNQKHGHVKPDSLDPHIWLSSHNAIAISKHISQQLIISDPNNAVRYKENLRQLINKITLLSTEIKTNLKNNKQPFITYHDAFQYFEHENKLDYVASINFDEETGTSLKHLNHIKTSIEKNNIQCLVYQPPKPDIIEILADKTAIKTFALDPLGQTIDNEKEALFEIMRDIALNFKRCLNY